MTRAMMQELEIRI